jgi:alpha-amylase/alpha-mannosidase (GH57 family)
MPHPLYVAFIWHQHQPFYRSHEVVDGQYQYRLPWVRLHGTKDYLDLVLLLERYPKLHQTVNLVPSLIRQIEDYVNGVAMDPYLRLSLTPVEQLSDTDKQFIIEHFFDAHHHHMVDPHPRYSLLYQQRQTKGRTWCWENWTGSDYGDLLAWHNLCWFDPLFWEDPAIASWLSRGKDFSLDDRRQIYQKQQEIMAQIIPQHRKMQESGQLEIITTPYTHPIMPLLADTDAGRVAVPQMQLPKARFQWAEDIPRHLTMAKQMYTERFGTQPRGLWPSEQSVSPTVLPYIRQAGFDWLCSDEGVLGWSINHYFHRNEYGNIQEPEILYQPYRLETDQGDLAIVFRDHRLSDLIGFTYGGMTAKNAAQDLIAHLEAISRRLAEKQETTALEEPWLVTIALDGENCWEFYEQDGKIFLETLYEMLSDHTGIQLVTVSEYLQQFPPRVTIPAQKLHSGSWIDANFTTWIGDQAKNRAWDLLTAARHVLAAHPEATPETNPAAWEALYAAEGSDWFWWFGHGHSSNHDAIFDQLFREHLSSLYQALGEPVPPILAEPIEDHTRKDRAEPIGFIHPIVNGIGDEQDWDKAGRIDVGGSRGTMHQSTPVQRIWYGVDHLNFYLRIDFQAGAIDNLPNELHLLWFYPGQTMHNSPPPLAEVPRQEPLTYLYHHHLGINLKTLSCWLQEAGEHFEWHNRPTTAKAALDQCLEVSVPWPELNIKPKYQLQMILIQADHGRYRGHLPAGSLKFEAP